MCWLGTETLKTFKALKTPVFYFARLWKETFKYYRARCGVCVLWLYGCVETFKYYRARCGVCVLWLSDYVSNTPRNFSLP